MHRYMKIRQFADALAGFGIVINPRTLQLEAAAEAELVAAGKISPDERLFLFYGGRWYVHAHRYCRAHGLDCSQFMADDDTPVAGRKDDGDE